jgi:hypothetical protein
MAEPYERKQVGDGAIVALKSDWEQLRPIRQDRTLGPAAGRAFCEYLWPLANHAPGRLKISTRQMGAEFGMSREAADNWLVKMSAAGRVHIFERDEKRGTVDLYVFHPSDEVRIVPVDPQKTLDFPDDEPPPPVVATIPMTRPADAAPKPVIESPDSVTLPAQSPKPVIESPDSVTLPAQSPKPVTESPDSVTPGDPGKRPLDSEDIGAILAVIRGNPTNTNTKKTSASCQASKNQNQPSAIQDLERAEDLPPRIGDLIPSAVQAMVKAGIDTRARKDALRQRILQDCPELREPSDEWPQGAVWMAEKMAHLATYGIPPGAPIPEADIMHALSALAICRTTPRGVDTPGAWLNSRFRRIADAHGYEWCANGKYRQRE